MQNFLHHGNFRLTFFIAMLFIFGRSHAQNQNALDFDNIDDNVTVTNASALIANSSQISMTCWVYPTNTPLVWTDYDGFCGFRNDASADFYLVQTTATAVEARFRNSSNVAFNINFNGLQLNIWQHFALTYDGSSMKLYYNGALVGDTTASGTITTTSSTFYMGLIPYLGTNFYLLGHLDEVSLWNYTLSQPEIQHIFQCELDTTASGLQLCYKMNQGIADGNNTAITTLHDNTGNIDGVLHNFALTGTTSNFVPGALPSYALSANICPGSSYNFSGTILTTAGTYSHTYTSSSGCDSVIVLTLNVTNVNTSILQTGIYLTALATGASYQWVNCATGYSIISGATGQTYTATANGYYAVIVTQSGCTDTSTCYHITTVDVPEIASSQGISIYPNPVRSQAFVDFGACLHDVQLSISNITGQVVMNSHFDDTRKVNLDVSDLVPGIYMMQVTTADKKSTIRMVKE